MLTYHKAVTDEGGAIGIEISSGVVENLLPEIMLEDQSAGISIPRKFFIKNDRAEDVTVSNMSMDAYTAFSAVLFASSGDAQVIDDLTGEETDESPMSVVIPANGHLSFWLRVDVPENSTVTKNYNTIDVKSKH